MRFIGKLIKLFVIAAAVVSISTSTCWAVGGPTTFNNLTQIWDNGTDLHALSQYFINGTPTDINTTNTTDTDFTPPSWLVTNSGTFATYFSKLIASDYTPGNPLIPCTGQDCATIQTPLFGYLLVGPGNSNTGNSNSSSNTWNGNWLAGYDTFNQKSNSGSMNMINMAYPSALGLPPAGSASNFQIQEYIYNAAGLYNNHPIPTQDMQGSLTLKQRYTAYYKTVIAIQSYVTYILSRIETDYQNLYGNGSPPTPSMADNLEQLATSSGWATLVESESIGKVQRHMLFFISQSFVVNMRILKNIEELNISQAMTNSLLILMNQRQENQLLRDAQGLGPGKG